GLTTTLKNAWTTSRQVNFFWVANFNLKFGKSTTSSLTRSIVNQYFFKKLRKRLSFSTIVK
ncbi:hypothetical protein ACREZO_08075, partial [Streptococcus pneumoniae]|uniref:hypothetical protein n=1 Tax=Streptococcus pneumoniae TaxID=1313 RepID=UPI001C5C9C25